MSTGVICCVLFHFQRKLLFVHKHFDTEGNGDLKEIGSLCAREREHLVRRRALLHAAPKLM